MEEEKFEGFLPPVSNYFRMPNEWVNISAKITNLAELKVVEYVLRHTWGYHEYDGQPKPITTDEFMHGRKRADGSRMDEGTGLSNKSVVEGLKRAIEHEFLICVIDDTDKARIVKAYALKMASADHGVKDLHTQNSYVTSTHQLCNIYTPAMKNLHSGCVDSSYRSEKETQERNFKKDTVERKNATSRKKASVSTGQEATHSSIHSSLSQSKNSSFSSSPEEKQEEVEFSPEEQAIYDFGKKDIFKAKPPAKTAKLKSECAELVPHIKMQEQFDSLLAFVRSLPYIKGQIHIKNLVNGLNGWLQPQEAQSTPSSSRQKPSGPFIAQQPTESELEEIHRKNAEAIAKMKARTAARKAALEAENKQKGAKA